MPQFRSVTGLVEDNQSLNNSAFQESDLRTGSHESKDLSSIFSQRCVRRYGKKERVYPSRVFLTVIQPDRPSQHLRELTAGSYLPCIKLQNAGDMNRRGAYSAAHRYCAPTVGLLLRINKPNPAVGSHEPTLMPFHQERRPWPWFLSK